MEIIETREVKFKLAKDIDGFYWLLNHNFDMAFDGHIWRRIEYENFPRTKIVGEATINEFMNFLEVIL